MKKLYCFLILVLLSAGLTAQGTNPGGTSHSPYSKSQVISRPIVAPGNTWGYEILIDSVLFIHQPSIPAVQGNLGFRVKNDALKVADLVIIKIRAGIIPPTVTRQELEKLRVTLK